MNKKICINQFFKNRHNAAVVDNYIHAIHPNKKFILSNKRRLYHIRNSNTFKHWVLNEGVKI